MKVYLANISGVLPRHYEMLTPERAQKAARYKFEDDRRRCVAGGLLMTRFLGGATVRDNGLGKPVVDGICFNLTHSGDWVALAVSESETGCDLERHHFTKWEKAGKIVFTDKELALLKASPDKAGVFFDLWTRKEALLKCIGEGFHREARSVDVRGDVFDDNGRRYRIKTRRFSDYTLSLCGEGDFGYELVFVDLSNI